MGKTIKKIYSLHDTDALHVHRNNPQDRQAMHGEKQEEQQVF